MFRHFARPPEGYNPDVTADERRMIDEALKAGKVTKVPRGTSGIPQNVWNEQTGKLELRDAEGNKVDGREVFRRGYKRRPDPRVLANRDAVRRWHAKGLWNCAIARKVGMSYPSVRKHLEALGLEPNAAPPRKNESRKPKPPGPRAIADAARAERDKEIIRLIREGKEGAEIEKMLGVSRFVVYNVANREGVPLSRRTRPAVARRQKKIAALAAKGMHLDDIAADLRVSSNTIRANAKAAGIEITRKPVSPRKDRP